jgi:IMP dehydrogenase/GMP reductase
LLKGGSYEEEEEKMRKELKEITFNFLKDKKIINVEGEKTLIPYKGSIAPIIEKYLGALASGMTYLGAKEMKNIIGKADFIEMTNSGMKESEAHGIQGESFC